MSKSIIIIFLLLIILAYQNLPANEPDHIIVGLRGDVATINMESGRIDWLIHANEHKIKQLHLQVVEEGVLGIDKSGSITLALLGNDRHIYLIKPFSDNPSFEKSPKKELFTTIVFNQKEHSFVGISSPKTPQGERLIPRPSTPEGTYLKDKINLDDLIYVKSSGPFDKLSAEISIEQMAQRFGDNTDSIKSLSGQEWLLLGQSKHLSLFYLRPMLNNRGRIDNPYLIYDRHTEIQNVLHLPKAFAYTFEDSCAFHVYDRLESESKGVRYKITNKFIFYIPEKATTAEYNLDEDLRILLANRDYAYFAKGVPLYGEINQSLNSYEISRLNITVLKSTPLEKFSDCPFPPFMIFPVPKSK